MYPQKFNPQISSYLEMNGFRKIEESHALGLLTFRKDDIAVSFWNDKIEKRIISPDKTKVNKTLTAFKGFDGQDVFRLMLILHLMEAIDLKNVSAYVHEKVGCDVVASMEKEFSIIAPETVA